MEKGFVYVLPMKSNSEVLQAIKKFSKQIGASDSIIPDAVSERKFQALWKIFFEMGTTLRVLEERNPWANKAKLYIGIMKEVVQKDMNMSNFPLDFLNNCIERRDRINNLTAKDQFKLQGSNAHTMLTGKEVDISNLCQYA